MQRIQLPDGSVAEFPDGMADADIERVLSQEKFEQPKSILQTYVTDPFASMGAGVAERYYGVRQALDQGNQDQFADEIAKARKFQEERGIGGTIGGVIGRDVLAPIAAGAAFANPLSWPAIGTAALTGGALGYTTPSEQPMTQGERTMSAIVSAPTAAVGQIGGALIGRGLEKAGRGVVGMLGGVDDTVPSPALASERVGEALRGQYGSARQATRGAYEAVEQAGEAISPQDIQNVFVPKLRQAYQEVAPIIPKAGPLAILRGAENVAKSNQPIPVSVLESLRKEAVMGGMDLNPSSALPYQTMRAAYDVAEQSLPNPSALQQVARQARTAQGGLFENPQEVARIVGAGVPEAQFTPPTGEQILQTIIGAGAKGKAGAANVIDDVLNAAGEQAQQVKFDIKQALVSRAYTQAGEDPARLAKELNKLVSQNESLARRVFSKAEVKSIISAAKGTFTQKFAETVSRPAMYTGGGLLGLLGTGAAAAGLMPALSGPAMAIGTGSLIGSLAARQGAADAAALTVGPLLRSIGIQSQVPGVVSRLLGPSAAGITTIPAQGSFNRQGVQ